MAVLVCGGQAQRLGRHASQHCRAADRPRAQRHGRLLRRWAEPRHHVDERRGEGETAWWLNLQAHADARVDLADGPRLVTSRAARGKEREQLWSRWPEIDKNLDAEAARRSTETVVIILKLRL